MQWKMLHGVEAKPALIFWTAQARLRFLGPRRVAAYPKRPRAAALQISAPGHPPPAAGLGTLSDLIGEVDIDEALQNAADCYRI